MWWSFLTHFLAASAGTVIGFLLAGVCAVNARQDEYQDRLEDTSRLRLKP